VTGLREVVEPYFRAHPDWREHPGEASAWEDLTVDPTVDRARLSLDLAVSRQLNREGFAVEVPA
jgi:hypothetical protein